MKLYMIKYIDLYDNRKKTGFLYTKLTDPSEVEKVFRRNYIGEINIIKDTECINHEMYIGDVGEVFSIYESHTF